MLEFRTRHQVVVPLGRNPRRRQCWNPMTLWCKALIVVLALLLLNNIVVPVLAVKLPPAFTRGNQQQQQNKKGNQQQQQKNEGSPGPGSTADKPSPGETGTATGAGAGTSSAPFPFEVSSLWISTLDRFKSMLQQHLRMQRKTYQKITSILLYKPPVGIFTVYTVFQLIASGRIFRLYDKPKSKNGDAPKSDVGEGVMQEEFRKPKRSYNKGRSLTLEEQDQSYHAYGVIERVRGRLCVAALSEIVEQQQQQQQQQEEESNAPFRPTNSSPLDSTDPDTQYEHFKTPWIYATALEALQISCPPGGSRSDYLFKLKEPLSQLKAAETYAQLTKKQDEVPIIVKLSTMTVEVRATDALLRVARDRLLKSSYRLERTVKYWNRRVEQANALTAVQQSLMRGTIDGDRLRLSYAQAAYNAELRRLGRVTAMLLLEKNYASAKNSSNNNKAEIQRGRPKEMDDSHLLRALKKSGTEERRPPNQTPSQKKAWRRTWRVPKISRYSLRFERFRPVLRKLEKDTYIEGTTALDVLLEQDKEGMEEWYQDAAVWIKTAKTVLCEMLEDSLEASVSIEEHRHLMDDLESIKDSWEIVPAQSGSRAGADNSAMSIYKKTNQAWGKALFLVEDIRDIRRVGEGKVARFRDLSIVGFFKDFDAFGIPSALLKIYLAHLVHAWASPYFPMARKAFHETWEAVVTVFLTRFYEPAKGVLMDVLNRSKNTMMEDFNLQNEEHSLDIMLKDLNLGNGTPEDRQKAIESASRAYENDLKSGLFRHVASGHLVRLMLVQVQQLKVGMLNAVEDIDVLIEGNKLNVRALSTIPAFVIVWFTSRLISRHLYNLRSRDVRPISTVHEEMTEHLNQMKSIILLSNGVENEEEQGDTRDGIVSSSVTALSANDLGEFALRMHCYLVLLDYCSPQPFPKWYCDDIHRSMREVLGSLRKRHFSVGTGLGTDRPLALVDLVMKKHEDLRRHL